MNRLKTLQKWLVLLIFSPIFIASFAFYFGLLFPLLVICMPKAVLPRIKDAPEPFVEFFGGGTFIKACAGILRGEN